MPARSHYEVLGVSRTADADTIKSAYRKLAMKFHPDRNAGSKVAEQSFREATEAFEVLSNPETRRAYDKDGDTPPPRPARPAGPTGGVDELLGHFSKVFSQMFQSARERNDAIQRGELCSRCRGRGVIMQQQGSFAMKRPCPDCKGTGKTGNG